MGMAASQARLLSITARLADNELRSQTINNAKMRLASETAQASDDYVEALNRAQLMFSNAALDGTAQSQILTFNALNSYSPYNTQYGLVSPAGQVYVSETEAEMFKSSTDLNNYLQKHGLEWSTTYFASDKMELLQSEFPGLFAIETDEDGVVQNHLRNLTGFEDPTFGETLKKLYEEYQAYDSSIEFYNFNKYMSAYKSEYKAFKSNVKAPLKTWLNRIAEISVNGGTDPNAIAENFADILAGKKALVVNNNTLSVANTNDVNAFTLPSLLTQSRTEGDETIQGGYDLVKNTYVSTNNATGSYDETKHTYTYEIPLVPFSGDDKKDATTNTESQNGENNTVQEDAVPHLTIVTDEDGIVKSVKWPQEEAGKIAYYYQQGSDYVSTRHTLFTLYDENDDGSKTAIACDIGINVCGIENFDTLEAGGTYLTLRDPEYPIYGYKEVVFPDNLTITDLFNGMEVTINEQKRNIWSAGDYDYNHIQSYTFKFKNETELDNETKDKQLEVNLTQTYTTETVLSDLQDIVIDLISNDDYFNMAQWAEDVVNNPSKYPGVDSSAFKGFYTNRTELMNFLFGAGKELPESVDDNCLLNFDNLMEVIATGKISLDQLTREVRTVINTNIVESMIDVLGEPKYAWVDATDYGETGNANAKAQWYTNLYNRMLKGFKVLEDGLANSPEWMEFALESGLASMEQVDPDANWISLDYKTCSTITQTTCNDALVAKAEAKYNRAMSDIEQKDSIYDIQLKNIDTEHSSLQTEYESVQKVIQKNIDRTMKFNQSA